MPSPSSVFLSRPSRSGPPRWAVGGCSSRRPSSCSPGCSTTSTARSPCSPAGPRRWGAVLDAVADRLGDLAFVGTLLLAGAHPAACAAGAALMLLQEYLRARAAAAGMAEVGVVTVWERPTRIVVTAAFLAVGGLPRRPVAGPRRRGRGSASAPSACVQLAVAVRRRLRLGGADQAGDDRRRQPDERQATAGVRGAADEEQPRHRRARSTAAGTPPAHRWTTCRRSRRRATGCPARGRPACAPRATAPA